MKHSRTPSLSILSPSVGSTLVSSSRAVLGISLGLPLAIGLAAATLIAAPGAAHAQDSAAPAATTQAAPQADAPKPDITFSNEKPAKGKARKQDEKVVQSKDSKKADKKNAKVVSLAGKDTKLPDKALYDKAQDAIKHGRYDVGRIDLQTLLNTYPESQYMMQSKLAIADSWYKEGGTAALTQAEQEYKDFITFFPNAPEAAEAQMRVGDIYFRQMDKPDRDYSKTQQAEQEYRLMLQQFPDSPLVPQAKQRLREVQEAMAFREAEIAEFYASHQNSSAAIARYQTIVDSYPLYSRMDEVLVGMGDQYAAMANNLRAARLPEDAKSRLLKIYDGDAQAAYDKVVLEHSASAHVEDARDRLVGMNLPVPTPTAEEVAASTALENSRGQYTLSKRAIGLFAHTADTVPAATIGEPLLEDPRATTAPDIMHRAQQDFAEAINPNAARPAASVTNAAPSGNDAAPAAPANAGPLTLENVPTAEAAPSTSSAVDSSVSEAPSSTPSSSGTGVGIQIVQPSGNRPAPTGPGNTAFPGTTPTGGDAPAQPAAQQGTPADNGGMGKVGPATTPQLAPIQHADQAPEPINEVKQGSKPQPTQPAATGKSKKNPKPIYDSDQESSSKHKPKKGLKKINPF
ncbi:MAG TPA: outer membrane protein assembly factor BamD [Acidobacteriaceae bacterium]